VAPPHAVDIATGSLRGWCGRLFLRRRLLLWWFLLLRRLFLLRRLLLLRRPLLSPAAVVVVIIVIGPAAAASAGVVAAEPAPTLDLVRREHQAAVLPPGVVEVRPQILALEYFSSVKAR